ncbi:hypothetical protein H0H81_007701 [Sphagnurus paluster]|uniref:Uncharacterized protein n=1 Tax=Sphagnurus paluster TaxID=117069 RepID=A0A9P7FQL8_9AGAR|nr:hypothetical protein H0H81_007701 [Sphagnurus paluster]
MRRLMHHDFQQQAVMQYHPHQLKATHRLLRRLLDDPDDILGHIRQSSGETIMSVAFGIQVKEKNDPYIEVADLAVKALSIASVPGAFLVDGIPIHMLNKPFDAAKRNIIMGAIGSCILGLLSNPEAQQEIDNVVGAGHHVTSVARQIARFHLSASHLIAAPQPLNFNRKLKKMPKPTTHGLSNLPSLSGRCSQTVDSEQPSPNWLSVVPGPLQKNAEKPDSDAELGQGREDQGGEDPDVQDEAKAFEGLEKKKMSKKRSCAEDDEPQPLRHKKAKAGAVLSDSQVEQITAASSKMPDMKQGDRFKAWTDLTDDDKQMLAESVTSHVAGKFKGVPLDLSKIENLELPGYSLAELAHWGYGTSSVAPEPCRRCERAQPCLVSGNTISCFFCMRGGYSCDWSVDEGKTKEDKELPTRPSVSRVNTEQPEVGTSSAPSKGKEKGKAAPACSKESPALRAQDRMSFPMPRELFAVGVRVVPSNDSYRFELEYAKPVEEMTTAELQSEREFLADREQYAQRKYNEALAEFLDARARMEMYTRTLDFLQARRGELRERLVQILSHEEDEVDGEDDDEQDDEVDEDEEDEDEYEDEDEEEVEGPKRKTRLRDPKSQ